MKRYHKSKRANPTDKFAMKIECKLCGNVFIVDNNKNLVKIDIEIERDPEERVLTETFLKIFKFNNKYARDVFELAIQYKSQCPSCGRKKNLFHVRYPKADRTYTYGEWIPDYNYYELDEFNS